MSHHRRALAVIVTAVLLDIGLGLAFAAAEHLSVWHGLYCGLATAVTVGGDVQPTTVTGYVVMAVICLTVVPLFAATFSLFTSGLTAGHVRAAEQRIKDHTEARLRHHLMRPAAQPGASGERVYDRERDGG